MIVYILVNDCSFHEIIQTFIQGFKNGPMLSITENYTFLGVLGRLVGTTS